MSENSGEVHQDLRPAKKEVRRQVIPFIAPPNSKLAGCMIYAPHMIIENGVCKLQEIGEPLADLSDEEILQKARRIRENARQIATE